MENLQPRKSLEFSDDDTVEITIAPNAGACFGVVRAIKLGRSAANRKSGNVFAFGPLIHNPQVVAQLENQGVKTVQHEEEVVGGTVILRSHGVQKESEHEFRERGVKVVDATCPLVKKPQRIASALNERGYFLIIVGDPNHPEVKGVLSYFGRPDYIVTYHPQDVDTIPATVVRVGVIAQTTIEVKVFDEVIRKCRERFSDVVVHNTICDATSVRQTEALKLAETAEVLVVIGGKNSSNTSKLVKICKKLQPNTHHIEQLEEIQGDWFAGKRKIGVTGGASTPHEYVELVGNHIADLIQNQNTQVE